MNNEMRSSIKLITREFYDTQRDRISLDNRLGLKKDGKIKKGIPERDDSLLVYLKSRRDEILKHEENIEKELKVTIHKHPLWKNFLIDVKGCGETMAAVIISEFDINIATTVSKLWAFSGLAPGKDKKEKGKKCPFNQFLRSKLCGVLGSSFLKCNSPYREYYDNMKHRLESQNWGIASKNPTNKKRPKAGHQHNASIRYMVKMFLKDLYVSWRTLEGLSVREPYQVEYLNKRHGE